MRGSLDRRAFLAALAGAGGGAALGPRGLAAAWRNAPTGAPLQPLGLQLYTVRTLLADDVPGTLAAVAEIGYREVETAGLHGVPAARFRALLDDHGLRAVSAHVGLDVLQDDPARALDEAATLGQRWLTVPWLAEGDRTPDGYRRVAEALNRAGEAAASVGCRVAYHNHDFEFAPLDGGVTGWALLVSETDAALVDLQMDLFWAVHAGADPVAWFQAHPGRFPMVHAKDRTASGDMVDVGSGAMDFRALLGAGRAAGLRHILVEHDRPAHPLESIRNSYATLAALEV